MSMASVEQFTSYLKTIGSSRDVTATVHLLRFFQLQDVPLATNHLLHLSDMYLQSLPHINERNKYIYFLNKCIVDFSSKHPVEIDVPLVSKVLGQQVIEIEDSVELIKIVSKALNKNKAKRKIKLKVFNEQNVMALVLDDKSCLTAKVFSNKVRLAAGQLLPLRPTTSLAYDEYMELKQDRVQYLSSQDYLYSFKMNGLSLKGYKLSPRDLMIKQSLAGHLNYESDIFFLLKSIEKHYIDLASDPFYQELCGKIDLAIDSLKTKQPEAILFAKKSIKLAYLALKYVFDDDNYLKYKLLELERTIKSEVQWVKQAQKTN